MTLARSGSRTVYRKSWSPVVRAVRTLASMDIPDDVRRRWGIRRSDGRRPVSEPTVVRHLDSTLRS